MTHDCQRCEDRLLDLLYDELDEADARSVRDDIVSCETCAGSWERLQAGHMFAAHLTLDEPPPALDLAILEAAQAKVSGSSAVAAPVADDGPGLWERVLDYLRSFAAGPQVAMATVMLLVVAIGLWYVPTDQQRADVAGETVMTADPESEAVATLPSAAVPAQLAAVPEAQADEAPEGRQEQDVARGALRRRRGDEASGRVVDGDLARLERPSTEREPAGLRDAPNDEGRGARRQAAMDDAVEAALDVGLRHVEVEAEPAPAMETETDGVAPTGAQSVQRAVTPQAAPAPVARMMAAAPEARFEASEAFGSATMSQGGSSGSAGPGSRQNYDRGLAEYRNRNYGGAIRELDQVVRRPGSEVRTLVPSALHHVARSYRSQGNCRQAVSHYEDLLRRFARYPQLPRAMIEVADCYRRLGNVTAARAMLERASRHRSVQPDAVRELRRLDPVEEQRQRRVRRPSRSAPAPSSAAADESADAYEGF